MRYKFHLVLMVLLVALRHCYCQAQPASDYLKAMNSRLAGSPEAAQIMKYENYPVDLFNGNPQISYPIYTLQGKGIAAPLSFSYNAGGGIKIDEQASNIGLGWMLQAGGEITREIRGAPDDSGVGRFDDLITVDSYLTWWGSGSVLMLHIGEWREAGQGDRDMEPDIYYYSFGGNSGKYLYDDVHKEFVCITEKSNVRISFDKVNSVWKIVTDEGNQYYFSAKESSVTQVRDMNSATVGSWANSQTTSWKLTKIVNADATDSIQFSYSLNTYAYYTAGSNISYQLQNGHGSSATYRAPVNAYSLNNISGLKLTGITGSGGSVTFVDETANRLDLGSNQKAISKIIAKDVEGNVTDIFKFNYGYYDRTAQLGALPDNLYTKKSLRLDGFTLYGNSESNPNPLSYSFQYNSIPLPTRMSFTKDFWGYYNSNTDGSMLAPKMYLNYVNSVLPGADRSVDTSRIKAGILEKVTLPTGGTVQFNYESNTVGYSVKEATISNDVRTGLGMYVLKDSMELFTGNDPLQSGIYDTTFTINQPPNYVTNNFMGGAIADVNIWPQTQTPNCALDNNYPYFRLEKIAGIPGSPDYNTPFGRTFQCSGASNVLLPNGTYKMTAYVSKLNQASVLNSIRNFIFDVGYDVIPEDQTTNYNLSGLRIRSIVATDPYSGVSQTRTFRYHDPVTDSSYGKFIGSMLSSYQEVTYDGNAIWLIRTGSYNLPGLGTPSSNVVYPKVIEEVSDGTTVYRVEHNYSLGQAIFPNYGGLIPPLDIECARGNEERTDYKKKVGAFYENDKTVKRVFDYNPLRLAYPDSAFQRRINGIRCSYESYYGSSINGTPLEPSSISPYWTFVNRLYLTSDTTIEYEGGVPKLTSWSSYKYGDLNQQPIEVRSQDSKGAITLQRMGYAKDTGEPALASPAAMTTPLINSNRISEVLASRQYRDGVLLNQMVKRGHFAGSRFLMDSVLTAEYDSPLERELRVIDYDDCANPLTLEGRGNRFRKYIWRKDRNLALATCTMAKNSGFVFTSFEYPNEYPTINEGGRTTVYKFSGGYAYYLNGNLVFPGFDGSQALEVYAWVNQGSFSANGVAPINTGRTKGDWVLYKVPLPAATSVTVNGNVVLDQLVIVPAGSSFEGNVYDAAGRVTARVNQNMQTAFFEYDAMGRLNAVKDEKGNIVKSSAYYYQVDQ